MKIFLLRLVCFILFLVGILSLLAPLILRSKNFFSNRLTWYYVYDRVQKSREPISKDTLYLGDSVGNQFLPIQEKPNALMTNAGILMAGQYILAFNALEANPQIRCIRMVMVPNSLGWRWEGPTTFNNFVKPFLRASHIEHFSDELIQSINRKPYSWLAMFDFAKVLTLYQFDLSQEGVAFCDERLSSLSVDYLKSLARLCHERNVRLEFVSPPVPERRIASSKSWVAIRGQIRQNGLDSLFRSYFQEISYLPESYFSDDIHLANDYLNAHRQEWVKELTRPRN